MINKESVYIEAGKRAGLAMNEDDLSKGEKENKDFRKLQSVEKGFDKSRAQALYQNAYRAIRQV